VKEEEAVEVSEEDKEEFKTNIEDREDKAE
jgi:hypothetical protein